MLRRNLSVLVAAVLVALLCLSRSERNPYARYASRGFRMIDDLALEQPSDGELLAGAMRGMVDTLRRRGDEHSAYIEPRQAKPLQAEMRQEFGGVGVRIALEGEPARVTVVEPPTPGTPAYRAGVHSRDRIVEVDGVSIVGAPLDVVLDRMRGPAGAGIALTVERDGEEAPLELSMVREVIRLPSVIGDRPLPHGGWLFPLEAEPRIALVRITTFGNRTVDELRETLADLDGVRGVILDVRGNAGGALDAAVGVAELFLPDGALIVSTRGREGEVLDAYSASGEGPHQDLPLVVLVDRDTASASEIVAAALQDHGRAVVAGERSFGKGTVQQLLDVDGAGSLLKLTSASFWRPSGVNIHRSATVPVGSAGGVEPNEGIAFRMTESERERFFAWRRTRDLAPNADPLDVTHDDPAADAAPTAGPLEADRAVALAVEYLRSVL